jgi:hypothetical protein
MVDCFVILSVFLKNASRIHLRGGSVSLIHMLPSPWGFGYIRRLASSSTYVYILTRTVDHSIVATRHPVTDIKYQLNTVYPVCKDTVILLPLETFCFLLLSV